MCGRYIVRQGTVWYASTKDPESGYDMNSIHFNIYDLIEGLTYPEAMSICESILCHTRQANEAKGE